MIKNYNFKLIIFSIFISILCSTFILAACPSSPITNNEVDAQIEVYTDTGLAPFTVLFDGLTQSSSSNGELVNFHWFFGDSNNQYDLTDTGQLVGHRFETPGSYSVYVNITDETGVMGIACIDITVLAPTQNSNTYYVASSANGGSDSNNGLCPTDEGNGCGPWATISHVNSQGWDYNENQEIIPSGSKILFHSGDTFTTSGDWDTISLMRAAPYYITIGSYGNGNKPVIDVGMIYSGYCDEALGLVFDGIYVTGSIQSTPSYYSQSEPRGFRYPGVQYIVRNTHLNGEYGGWTISGISLENVYIDRQNEVDSQGISIDFQSFSHFLYFNNVTVLNSYGHGAYLAGETLTMDNPATNILVENSEFAYNGIVNPSARDGFTNHGKFINLVFRNNHVHHNGYALGIDAGYIVGMVDGGDAIEFMRDYVIEGNVIHDHESHTLQFSALPNLIFRNNILYNNPENIVVNFEGWDPANDGADVHTSNARIYNNIFYNNGGLLFQFSSPITEDIYIRNNIIVHPSVYGVLSDESASLTMSNNLYYNIGGGFNTDSGSYNLNQWLASQETNGEIGDPLFIDAANGNFRLQSNSPAIDMGMNLPQVPFDFSELSRPRGTTHDAGAFEYDDGIIPTETCYDRIQNQDETDIDCGGVCQPCAVEPSCSDGIRNGDETGVDCGGSCDACVVEPTCNDGIQNQDETDVDCGGSVCQACGVEPTCSDGIQNGDETGVDCGGSCSACSVIETCSDGIQNQDETGIDCGGSCNACSINTLNAELILHIPFDDDFSDLVNNVSSRCTNDCPTINTADTIVGQGALDTQGTSLELIQYDFDNSYSISFWINPQGSMTDFHGIIGQDQRRGNGDLIWNGIWISDGDLIHNDYNCGDEGGAIYTGLNLNTWYHVVFTYDGNFKRGYVNGNETLAISGVDSCSPITPLTIGELYEDYVDALIDDVRIYSGVLNVDQINNLYDLAGSSVTPTCEDGIQNQNESGIDCGGSFCNVCEVNNAIHDADTDESGDISLSELNVYINSWRSSIDVTLANLIEAIRLWKD